MVRVIGAGFGRTGTHSLGLALQKLGFGPCYNIQQVSKHDGHHALWTDAMDGKAVDWDKLFEGYNSAVEWPAIAFLPQILAHYPQAKVILTLRDPESWFESANSTIFEGLELSARNPDLIKRERGAMQRRLILEETFNGRYRDKEHAIHIFNQHNQQVIDLVPSERLLQYSVKEGWEPLCLFLDKSIPDEAFPHQNERQSFIDSAPEWAKKIRNMGNQEPD
jgi:hypothetical protein